MNNKYSIEELRTIKDLKDIFENKTSEEAWLFLSTGAFHGTHLTLDDLELIVADEHTLTSSVMGRYWVTVLVVYPKLTSASILDFGEILIDADDIQWLRNKVRETIKEVEDSQYGNI